MIRIYFNMVLCCYCMNFAMANYLINDTYTKVNNAANIYVGTKNFFQKINSFHINDSLIKCNERFLPILFLMINSQNKEEEVDGYLTEYGNLIDHQESTHCRVMKKYFYFFIFSFLIFNVLYNFRYFVNKNTFVLIFENKVTVVEKAQFHNVISKELYEKYFFTWLIFKINCFDEKHSLISVYCSVKEVGFHIQAAVLLILFFFSFLTFCYKHYKYYLVLRNILESQGNLDFTNFDKIKNKKK